MWRKEFAAADVDRGFFGLTLHPRFISRPTRLHMLGELLSWMRNFDGAWIATGRDVAVHVSQLHTPTQQ